MVQITWMRLKSKNIGHLWQSSFIVQNETKWEAACGLIRVPADLTKGGDRRCKNCIKNWKIKCTG